MRSSRFALLALSLLAGIGSCRARHAARASSASYAWWVTARFNPSETVIEGIPVHAIDSTWVSALALSRSVLPPEAGHDPSGLADSSVSFVLDGDFNGDGTPDRALVGVYRTVRGQAGRFLLILTRHKSGSEKVHLALQPGEPGFSVLSRSGDKLSWWECMECDAGWDFAWNGHEYALLPPDSSETE